MIPEDLRRMANLEAEVKRLRRLLNEAVVVIEGFVRISENGKYLEEIEQRGSVHCTQALVDLVAKEIAANLEGEE